MTKQSKALRAPSGMGKAGLDFWHRIVDSYDLRADELLILEDACRETELIDRMTDELAGSPLIVTGSTGQDVAHPLLSEIRAHRANRASLLRQLKIPDDPAAGGAPQVNQHRAAGQARWAKAHGQGA